MLKKLGMVLAALALAVAAAVFWVYQLPSMGGSFEGARLERLRASPEFKDGRFENTPPQDTDSGLMANLKPYLEGQVRHPTFEIPVVRLEPADLSAPPAGLRAFWFGHASVLVEIDGVRVMTDPVFSEYVSPVQSWPSPGRMHPVPLELARMPKVDAVVISHDHFDHLDMATIQSFSARGTHFYVGLGIGAHLERWGVPAEQIHELDWWQELTLGGLTIHCVPARHYSGRKKMNNSTLWAAWQVKGPHHSFYFSGDTGYGPHFAEARKRLGAVDLSLIKIGAYGDTWVDIHMAPESAVRAHQDLGAKVMLPVHWATFNLAYHAWEEPIVRAVAAARASGIRLVTPAPGELVDIDQPFKNREWYLGGEAKR